MPPNRPSIRRLAKAITKNPLPGHDSVSAVQMRQGVVQSGGWNPTTGKLTVLIAGAATPVALPVMGLPIADGAVCWIQQIGSTMIVIGATFPPGGALPVVGGIPPGGTIMWIGTAAPSGWLICDGSAISRTAFSALFTTIGVNYGVGDGSTTFNIPDLQGRMPVGKGAHADVTTLGLNEGLTSANRRPKHKHTINDAGHTHQEILGNNPGAVTTGQVVVNLAIFGLSQSTGSSVTGITAGPQTGAEPVDSPAYEVFNFIIKT